MFLDRILQICCVLTLTIGVVSYAPRCNGLVSLTPNGLSLKRNSNDFLQMHTKQHKRVHELNGRTYLADGQVDSKYTNSKIMIKVLGTLAATLVSFKKPAFAAAMDKALNVGDIKGWDLYGRVPFDDWIFSTARLTNPEILKRSIVEVVRSFATGNLLLHLVVDNNFA